MTKLYDFKPATNHKGVYTAERHQKSVELAHYNMKGERKVIVLSDESQFFGDVHKIELLTD